jgi:UDP-glucose 4-epimerase
MDEGRSIVTVARRFDNPAVGPRESRVLADLRDSAKMASFLPGLHTVVQLMGSSTPAQGNARTVEDIENNVIPHVRFLNRCVDAGVQRFVFISSGGAVYGPTCGEPVSEMVATNPISSHGVTKLMVEKFVQLHAQLDGLDHVILRVANPFGPGQVFRHGQGLIPALLDHHRRGLPVQILGDGSASRDYVYIDDVIDAIIAAVDIEDRPRLIANIGTGIGRSVLEVVRAIEEIGGLKFAIEYVDHRPSDVHSIALDWSLAQKELGWEPRTSFRDGVVKMLATWST